MKKMLRGVGIGLFLAGASLTLLDFLDSSTTQQTDGAYEKEITELQQKLKQANKEIASLKEAAPSGEGTEESSNKETSDQKATSPEENTEEAQGTSATVYIYEGVSLYDIGKQVEDAGIIANSRELELYLSKPEYARSIQKGQFELNSNMTIEEMAKILTGKNTE